MSAHDIVNEIRSLGGRIEARGDRLHIDAPQGRITLEIRERLKENKEAILRRLELEGSMKRLEAANILLAISEDGDLRIVQSDADAHRAAMDGFTIYMPRDAYMYVTLSERERRMLHEFKKQFGGTIEWKESDKA